MVRRAVHFCACNFLYDPVRQQGAERRCEADDGGAAKESSEDADDCSSCCFGAYRRCCDECFGCLSDVV
jgi:hypothetical protein